MNLFTFPQSLIFKFANTSIEVLTNYMNLFTFPQSLIFKFANTSIEVAL